MKNKKSKTIFQIIIIQIKIDLTELQKEQIKEEDKEKEKEIEKDNKNINEDDFNNKLRFVSMVIPIQNLINYS